MIAPSNRQSCRMILVLVSMPCLSSACVLRRGSFLTLFTGVCRHKCGRTESHSALHFNACFFVMNSPIGGVRYGPAVGVVSAWGCAAACGLDRLSAGMARFALPDGLFCIAERAVLQCRTARIAQHRSRGRFLAGVFLQPRHYVGSQNAPWHCCVGRTAHLSGHSVLQCCPKHAGRFIGVLPTFK